MLGFKGEMIWEIFLRGEKVFMHGNWGNNLERGSLGIFVYTHKLE